MSEKMPTATEVLVEAMESFGESEPEVVLVLYTNAEGNLVWKTNTDSIAMKLGMMMYAEACMLNRIFKDG